MARLVLSVDSVTKLPPTNVLAALDARGGGGGGGTGDFVVLIYSSGAYPARPSGLPAGHARYLGPVQPTTWLVGDEWVDNS